MSSVVLSGDSSGTITLAAPAVAGSNTITLPAQTGTSAVLSSAISAVGQIPFSTDGSTLTPTAKIVSGTVQATTSGTSITFTGIPSWVKRITVMFQGVSTSGTSSYLIQIGSGSVTNTGYLGASAITGGSVAGANYTTGFGIYSTASTQIYYGQMTIVLISGNSYVSSHALGRSDSNYIVTGGSAVTLSGALDRVVLTTVNGTDTFDAGSVNILYE